MQTGLLAIVALAASTPAHAFQPEWTQFFSKIVSAGEAADADQFADVDYGMPPLPSSVQIPFQDGTTNEFRPETDAFWVYEDGKLRLNFSPSSNSLYKRSNGFVLRSWITPNGSYTGRNAYGVSARVSRAFVRTVAVETSRMPLGEPSPYRSKWAETSYGNNYWIDVPASGAEARKLTANAYVELSMKANERTAQSPHCRTLLDTPTINHPIEATRTVCGFSADVMSIAIKRRDTGETLAQWPRVGDGADPVPIGDERSWITSRDYPYLSKRDGEVGELTMELTIGPDGKPASCRVTKGSGFKRLDTDTCRTLNDRAKFEPFEASEKRYTRVVRWPNPDLPGEMKAQ